MSGATEALPDGGRRGAGGGASRLLHIGQRKTGTTWLQSIARNAAAARRLQFNHAQLAKHMFGVGRKTMDDAHLAGLAALLPKGRAKPAFASLESLIVLPPARVARAVRAVWPDAQILITTRGPASYLLSSFDGDSLHGRHDETGDFATRYLRKHMARSHDLDGVAAAYGEVFGRDRVHLLPYELLRDDQTDYLRRVSDLLGVDLAAHTDRVVRNASPSPTYMLFHRRLNKVVTKLSPELLETKEWRQFTHLARSAVSMAPGFDAVVTRYLRLGESESVDLPVLPRGALERLGRSMTVLRDHPLYQPYLALYGLGAPDATAGVAEPA